MPNSIRTPIAFLVLACVTSTLFTSLTIAGTFRRTKSMDLKYAWGTTSMAEFDAYDLMYPGYFPIAELTLEPDGTFTVLDTATGSTGFGIYDKSGRNLEITIVSPSYGYTVQYVGRRVSRGVFEGEILVDGNPQGNWRGTF